MALGSWITTFETENTNATTIDQTDDELNQHRVFVRERGQVEHDWGSGFEAGYTDQGRHTPGSARAFFMTTTPTKLMRADNSGNQTASSSTLTGAKDQGRLWIDTSAAGLGKLKYYTAAGSWASASAVPTWPTPVRVSSTDVTAIPATGSTITVGSWSATIPTIVTPAAGTWQLFVQATILVSGDNTAERLARVSMVEVAGSLSTTLLTQEHIIRPRISASFVGATAFDFFYTVAAGAGNTYTFEFECEANNSGPLLGAGAPWLATVGGSGEVVANRVHTCNLWMEPRA